MKALNVVEKATIKGHLIRALKEQTAQHRLQNLPLRTLSPGSNRMLTSPIMRLISFNVWNRPLDEYVLAEFKTFINPFFPMLLYFKAQPSVSWENEKIANRFLDGKTKSTDMTRTKTHVYRLGAQNSYRRFILNSSICSTNQYNYLSSFTKNK